MTSIRYLGHSAICIELEDSSQILIDPFISGNPLCPNPEEDFSNLKMICLSHAHADHVGDTLRLAKESNCKVCATFELAALLAKDGVKEENLEFMNKGGSISANGVVVTLEQAFHSSSYVAADGSTHYAGEAASVIISLDRGPTIYHAGDTLLFSDMSLIASEYQPDIALLPIGDRFTMGPRQAASAAKLIQAKKVIPIHYATFDALNGTAQEFVAEMSGLESEVVVLEPGQELSC